LALIAIGTFNHYRRGARNLTAPRAKASPR